MGFIGASHFALQPIVCLLCSHAWYIKSWKGIKNAGKYIEKVRLKIFRKKMIKWKILGSWKSVYFLLTHSVVRKGANWAWYFIFILCSHVSWYFDGTIFSKSNKFTKTNCNYSSKEEGDNYLIHVFELKMTANEVVEW